MRLCRLSGNTSQKVDRESTNAVDPMDCPNAVVRETLVPHFNNHSERFLPIRIRQPTMH